jgi:alkylation response protein AidB-like acyl-CoA dehydrogenase
MLDQRLTTVDLSSAAQDVAIVAGERAADTERTRRLDPEVVTALRTAGFARHFVPTSCGGNASTFVELTRAISTVGEGCTATAWCASLVAHLARMAAHLPAEGYQEIWADGPDSLVVGSLTPLGNAKPVAGGWRLSGEWAFISGVDFSDWALVGAMVAAGQAPEARIFAIPRGAYRIAETWFNVGMAGTGSNTLIVEDLFVPAARTMSRDDLFAGRAADSTAACHAVPMQATTLMFATPALGGARGALKSWSAYITQKMRNAAAKPAMALPGMPTFNRTQHDVTLARCAGEIDAAQLLLERASLVLDESTPITPLETMRNWRDCALATDMMVAVVNRLFRAIGTTGQSAVNPVQRFWRDVNSLAGHMGLQFESAASAYGQEIIKI